MGKKIKQKKVIEAKKTEYYKKTDTFGNVEKLIYPNTLQVGLKNDIFNSTISGSIHHTRQGLSYLVAGSNIGIVSGSNGQVTISATAGSEGSAGPATPDASFTRSVIPVNTDDTGGALDDGNDLADADISQQAFTKIDVNAGVTNVTFAGHNASGDPASNNYKIVSANVTATTDNGTSLTITNDASGENDVAYNLTCANASATRLKLAVSSDSSDAKLRVSYLSEHEDGSNTDFNSVLVDVPIKITSAAGTQTITRSFTVQKIKKGTTGDTGSTGSGGSNGNDTPNVSLTRTVVTIGTDPTGGAFDDGGDLSDADISNLAFTKIDANVGATNVTFAGHNESGNPSNNTYKIVTDSMTATTDNGTVLTVTNAASEGDTSYDITCANSGNRLKLAVTTVSNDAQIRITSLAEHEDGSNTDFDNIVVAIPVKITTAAGTQTMTRSFTVQKIKKGTNGSNGDDGDDGAAGSGVVVSLDPMSVILPAASNGTVSSYTASGATIKVHENGSAINVDTTLGSNSRWFVVTATGSSITAGSISQTNGQSSATIADASSISATTATIEHVVRVKNSLGVTSDYTLTQTLTKAIAGTNGSNGSDGADGAGAAIAIYQVRNSGSNVPVSREDSNIGQFNVPFTGAMVTNTNVVASDDGGALTLGAAALYSITVSMQVVQDGDSATQEFVLSLNLSDGGSASTLSFEDSVVPGGNTKTGSLLISNAVITTAGGGAVIIAQIKKGTANATHLEVPQSSQALATIRVEKLS